jgi:hypothetical protein
MGWARILETTPDLFLGYAVVNSAFGLNRDSLKVVKVFLFHIKNKLPTFIVHHL